MWEKVPPSSEVSADKKKEAGIKQEDKCQFFHERQPDWKILSCFFDSKQCLQMIPAGSSQWESAFLNASEHLYRERKSRVSIYGFYSERKKILLGTCVFSSKKNLLKLGKQKSAFEAVKAIELIQ